MTYEELQEAYFQAVADENEAKAADIAAKIAEIQRKAIFKACVRCLSMRNTVFSNLFRFAANFADVAVREELTPEAYSYEIGSYYTKNRCPYVVHF